MILPKRPVQHIIESKSFRIFSHVIPEYWIIREVTERDYGIDCYIELVTQKGYVTGDLVSIQLKGVKEISWSTKQDYLVRGIQFKTWHYWHRYPVPVFLFLVDCSKLNVYYQSISDYTRKNYKEIIQADNISCTIPSSNLFHKDENYLPFIKQYFLDYYRDKFEEAVISFVANINLYNQFILENVGRDSFMGVELKREYYARHLRTLLEFLCDYLDISWDVPTINELRITGQMHIPAQKCQ